VSGEEKRREEEYTYTYIRIPPTKTKHTFYTPKNLGITFQKLEEILKREGSCLSHWIQTNAVDYVRLHEPGNPQQRIDTIIHNGHPYHARTYRDCRARHFRKNPTPPFEAYCSHEKRMINKSFCDLCGRWKIESPPNPNLLGAKP